MQEATFKLRTAIDSAPGKANVEKCFSSVKAGLDSIRVSGTNFDAVFSTIDSAFRKLEPSRYWNSRPVADKVLIRISALIGSKFVSLECPGLTSSDALVYFWTFCRMMEYVRMRFLFARIFLHAVLVLGCEQFPALLYKW